MYTDRQTDRQTQTDRHGQTDTDRHRQTDTDRHRQTDTDRQTDIQTLLRNLDFRVQGVSKRGHLTKTGGGGPILHKSNTFSDENVKRAVILLSIFLQNFRTVFGDKDVKNVQKCCGNLCRKMNNRMSA